MSSSSTNESQAASHKRDSASSATNEESGASSVDPNAQARTITAAAGETQPPPSKRNKAREEYMKFRGRRAPRVGDSFQASILPSPATHRTQRQEETKENNAGAAVPNNSEHE